MCFYSDGGGEMFSNRVVVARKVHNCGECPTQIQPGEPYRKYVGKYEGDFFQFPWCARCDFIRHAIHWYEVEVEKCDESESWPLAFGNLCEDWSEGDYDVKLGLADDEARLDFRDIARW